MLKFKPSGVIELKLLKGKTIVLVRTCRVEGTSYAVKDDSGEHSFKCGTDIELENAEKLLYRFTSPKALLKEDFEAQTKGKEKGKKA